MHEYKLKKHGSNIAVYDCDTPIGTIGREYVKRLQPLLKRMLETVCDDAGIPLNLHFALDDNSVKEILLDDEIGAKIGLITRLLLGKSELSVSLDRAELLTRRITRFSREEAAYWLGRCTSFSEVANTWGAQGLLIILCGDGSDDSLADDMLERERYR